jgi:hypothetical protein
MPFSLEARAKHKIRKGLGIILRLQSYDLALLPHRNGVPCPLVGREGQDHRTAVSMPSLSFNRSLAGFARQIARYSHQGRDRDAPGSGECKGSAPVLFP